MLPTSLGSMGMLPNLGSVTDGGSGGTRSHHAYAVDQGLGLREETVESMHYDDATQLLMVIKVSRAVHEVSSV